MGAMSEPRIEDRPVEPDPGGAVAAPVARPASTLVVWGTSAAVIGVFLVIDFMTPYTLGAGPDTDNWWMIGMLGICIGQVNLIAAWAVLAPGNLVVRLPWSLLLAMAMWYALVLGFRVFRYFGLEDAILLGTVLLAGVTIAQVPLWIAKRVFRWRLILGADDAVQAEQGPWQFNLQHLLVATFLWAVALSPLRKVLPPGPVGRLHVDGMLFVLLGAVVVCNLLVAVPCIWGALVSGLPIGRLAVGWLFYCGLLTGVEFGVLCAVLGPPGDGAKAGMGFLLINLCQCATVFGTLRIYRARGFRLVRRARRKEPQPAQPVCKASKPCQ